MVSNIELQGSPSIVGITFLSALCGLKSLSNHINDFLGLTVSSTLDGSLSPTSSQQRGVLHCQPYKASYRAILKLV